MADFSNRQLAEIITQTSEKISSNILKERKIANELAATQSDLIKSIEILKNQITDLKTTSIKPDLSQVNNFYEEKTKENIERVNSRLKVPNLILYIGASSLGLFLLTVVLISYFVKSKQEIINNYQDDLKANNKIIVNKDRDELLKDMMTFFEKNPKSKEAFINQRKK